MREPRVRDLRAAHGQRLEGGHFGEPPHAVIGDGGIPEVEVRNRGGAEAVEAGVGNRRFAERHPSKFGQGADCGKTVPADTGSGQADLLQVGQVAQRLDPGVGDRHLIEGQFAQGLEIDQIGHPGIRHPGARHRQLVEGLEAGEVSQARVRHGRSRDGKLFESSPPFERHQCRVRDRRARQVKAEDGRKGGQMSQRLRAEIGRLESQAGHADHVLGAGQVFVSDLLAADQHLAACVRVRHRAASPRESG
jgi:hypothetical protein